MLAFGIQYLNRFVAAAETDCLDLAEWPPHPGRVFMALAAAHFQTGAHPEERKALLWLEALEKIGEPVAPSIVASDATQRPVVTHYVPVNDDSAGYKKKEKKTVVFQEIGQTGLRRNRQDRTFARAWLPDDSVFFVWSDVEPDSAIRTALASLCSKVTRIGHSTSMVQMWLAGGDQVGDPNWVPDDERAVVYLRLAVRGTLEYLEERFNREANDAFAKLQVAAAAAQGKKARMAARKQLQDDFPDGPPRQLRPNLSVYQGYAPPAPADATSQTGGTVFSPHMIVLRLDRESGPYRVLDLACVLSVSSRWREALLSQSNDLPISARAILSGHDADGVPLEDRHLAFVPFAFVGHEHADGHLLGMGISLPPDLSPDDRRGVLTALGRVRLLKLGRLGAWRVEAVTASRPAWNLRAIAWTAFPEGATQWSTITPVVFDRHPKSKEKAEYLREVAAMIGRGCSRIGLPMPREVIVTAVSAHLGVPPAHSFPPLHRKDGSARRHTHAILLFDEPVCGPVLVGAGRYRGYGVCRPLNEAPPNRSQA